MKPGSKFKRGDISSEHPGLVFWVIHRSKEVWLTPEQFKQFRQKKNTIARKWSKTPIARASKRAAEKRRNQTPSRKEYNRQYQRKKRHIYSPRSREWRNQYKKRRLATDTIYRFRSNFSKRMSQAINRGDGRKSDKSVELLGCTYYFFRDWLARQFLPGMTWDNYADAWTVDHIIAVDLFDMTEPVSQRHAFNYRNCRPLWKLDNISKSNRLDMALVAKHELWDWLPYIQDQAPLSQAA